MFVNYLSFIHKYYVCRELQCFLHTYLLVKFRLICYVFIEDFIAVIHVKVSVKCMNRVKLVALPSEIPDQHVHLHAGHPHALSNQNLGGQGRKYSE